MTDYLKSPTEAIPFGITVTSGYRTKEEQDSLYKSNSSSAPNNPPHVAGKAIDIRDDEEGLKFWDWLLTSEGKAWKTKYGAKILYHSIKGGTPHYHIEFNY
tara:strand:- start:446 stop:748 length:303 start_codon:yes stop_codon:yes gene_type:complete